MQQKKTAEERERKRRVKGEDKQNGKTTKRERE